MSLLSDRYSTSSMVEVDVPFFFGGTRFSVCSYQMESENEEEENDIVWESVRETFFTRPRETVVFQSASMDECSKLRHLWNNVRCWANKVYSNTCGKCMKRKKTRKV